MQSFVLGLFQCAAEKGWSVFVSVLQIALAMFNCSRWIVVFTSVCVLEREVQRNIRREYTFAYHRSGTGRKLSLSLLVELRHDCRLTDAEWKDIDFITEGWVFFPLREQLRICSPSSIDDISSIRNCS